MRGSAYNKLSFCYNFCEFIFSALVHRLRQVLPSSVNQLTGCFRSYRVCRTFICSSGRMLHYCSKTFLNCKSSFEVLSSCRGLRAINSPPLHLINLLPSVAKDSSQFVSRRLFCLYASRVVVRKIVRPNNKLDYFQNPQRKSVTGTSRVRGA